MNNRFSVPTRVVLILAVALTAMRAGLYADGKDEKALSGQALERQKTIAWLEALFKRDFPTAHIEPRPGQDNSIVLTGRVKDAQDVDAVLRMARRQCGAFRGEVVTALAVASQNVQVQIDVLVASVASGELTQADADLRKSWESLAWDVETDGCAVTRVADPHEFYVRLQELRNAGLAKLLAEPRLITVSGRVANFVSGGQILIPATVREGRVMPPRYESRGTCLTFLPTVHPDGKIRIAFELTFSSLTERRDGCGQDAPGPRKAVRARANSLVLEDGQAFAILERRADRELRPVLPVLADVPVIGAFFRHEVSADVLVLVTAKRVSSDESSAEQDHSER